MADDVAASGGRLGNLIAQRRRRSRIGVVRALCGFLFLCAGCALSSGEAVSAPRPTPVMATTLLLKPVDSGRLTSGYGPRYNPVLKRRQMHRGIDWAAPRGTPVRAAGNGVVVAIERSGAYGRYRGDRPRGYGLHRLRPSPPLRVRPARRPPIAPRGSHRSDRQHRARHGPASPLRGAGRRPPDRPLRGTARHQRACAPSGPVRAPDRGRWRTRHRRARPRPSPTPRRAIPPSCRRGVWATCRSRPTAP